MSDLGKKVGYLKGLMEGMDLSGDPSRGKLLSAMADLLSEISDRVESMEELLDDLNDYVESIDDDLSELEGMHDEDDDFGSFDGYEDEEPLRLIKNDVSAPEKVMLPVRCPDCAAVFLISGAPSGRYVCPVCGKKVAPQRLTEKNTPIAKSAED